MAPTSPLGVDGAGRFALCEALLDRTAHRDEAEPTARGRGHDLHVPVDLVRAAPTLALAATRAAEVHRSVELSGDLP